MKVDFTPGMNIYKKQENTATDRETCAGQSVDAAVAEFSRGAAPGPQSALLGGKASVQNALCEPTCEVRLAELAQSIREGSYHIPTDRLVQAILTLNEREQADV